MSTLLAPRAGDPEYRRTSNGWDLPEAFEEVDTCAVIGGRVLWGMLGCILLAGYAVGSRLGGTRAKIVPASSDSPVKSRSVRAGPVKNTRPRGPHGTGREAPGAKRRETPRAVSMVCAVSESDGAHRASLREAHVLV